MLKFLAVLLCASSVFAAPVPARPASLDDAEKARRLQLAFKAEPGPQTASRVRAMALSLGPKAVPGLITVMKDATFPEKNRWHATMLLGQIMGKKSAPFIARFSEHPAWMMRVASLKALAALGMREYHAVYARALRDSSLIVRVQALDNITRMDIRELAPNVWGMMYDQTNYSGDAGKRQRTSIVRSVIRTVGALKYEKARAPMARLIQKPRYADLAEDLDFSLEKITGKVSPQGTEAQRAFWAKTVAIR
jgi:HEAT repeat protein